MHPLIEANRAKIVELCRQYAVTRLDVFGSILRDDFDPARSDVDVVAEFARGPVMNAFDQYFGFKEGLEAAFGRNVDVISVKGLKNPYMRHYIETTKALLYAA